jgi:hypothetical protein
MLERRGWIVATAWWDWLTAVFSRQARSVLRPRQLGACQGKGHVDTVIRSPHEEPQIVFENGGGRS